MFDNRDAKAEKTENPLLVCLHTTTTTTKKKLQNYLHTLKTLLIVICNCCRVIALI